MLDLHKFCLYWQVSTDDDAINAALKQLARLEQLVKHRRAGHSACSLTSPGSSGTTQLQLYAIDYWSVTSQLLLSRPIDLTLSMLG